MNLRIEWLGHSCFRLTGDGVSVVIDPYADDMIPGLAPLRCTADAVFCSHNHDDHGCTANVSLTSRSPELTAERLVVPHDDCGGTKYGLNRIHIFTLGGARVAHFGDIGSLPDAAQLARLKKLDAALIPVGGKYTLDADAADALARAIAPRVVIPMHYRTDAFGFDDIGTLSAFTALRGDVRESPDHSFVLEDDTPAQTLVLRYCPDAAGNLPKS